MRLRPALVALTAFAALSACGEERVTATGDDPTPEATTPIDAEPTWPAEGCDQHSGSSIDYVSDAKGADTKQEAAAAYMEPGDRFVRQGLQPKHYSRGWLVVTPDNEIRAILGIWNSGNGWLVDSVEECAR